MKFNFSMLLILLSIFLLGGCAQIKAKQYKKTKNRLGIYEAIKQYPLLVRLQTSEKKIKLLEAKGLSEMAASERKQTEQSNEQIMAAFHQNFDFTDVFFFHSNYGPKLKDGAYREIPFFNYKKESITDLKIEGSHYFVSEFSSSYSDMHIKEHEDGSSTLVAGSNPYPAVVIMDHNYVPVQGIKTKGVYAYKDPYRAVKEMNFALKSGYGKTKGKMQKLELRMKMRELKEENGL